MNLKIKLACALSIIGISFSEFAIADLYIFGNSSFSRDNGLNITTSTGDFFVSNSDSGWWASSAGHDAENDNYIAGKCCDIANHNNFFTFDLSAVSGNVISASLTLYSYDVIGSSIEYQLFDITSPLTDVRTSGTNVSVYNDLMSGLSYGTFMYNPSDSDQTRTLVLNSNGISDLNDAIGGGFGIGGTITGGVEMPPPVPEPETYLMWLGGLGLIGFWGYRRKKLLPNSILLA
ncbi:PEP-CTERM sorting domain-containing protein [Nitrosomonas sp. JL21]|uniref:PEP-CTERM sorting domain-containing protein n=1 Tax=Nitrosomonas sp. JL21 TaxID=153949 RepID=UPI0013719700|nr:PEP-CTERM sorting domain-containing protein [Nitrosomonas sp. JL21]